MFGLGRIPQLAVASRCSATTPDSWIVIASLHPGKCLVARLQIRVGFFKCLQTNLEVFKPYLECPMLEIGGPLRKVFKTFDRLESGINYLECYKTQSRILVLFLMIIYNNKPYLKDRNSSKQTTTKSTTYKKVDHT